MPPLPLTFQKAKIFYRSQCITLTDFSSISQNEVNLCIIYNYLIIIVLNLQCREGLSSHIVLLCVLRHIHTNKRLLKAAIVVCYRIENIWFSHKICMINHIVKPHLNTYPIKQY